MYRIKTRIENRMRRHTHWLRLLPSFIIIGGMKCGTTALYQYLLQHPNISESYTKEVHFFDSRYTRGVAWYRQYFPLISRGKITGEASPYYLFHPAAAERIKETLPHVKLIALVRNPVDRAYSHYQHTKRKGYETLSFEDAIEQEEERLQGEYERLVSDPAYRSGVYPAYSYVSRGIYWQQLMRYYEWFDPSQLLVIKSEDLFTDPQSVVNGVAAFLEIPLFTLNDAAPKNRAGYVREITTMHKQLALLFKPHNAKLYDLIGKKYDWDEQYGV